MDASEAAPCRKPVRTSVTVPIEDYQELELLARQNKVSVAWLIRDAVEKYLAGRRPLLNNPKAKSPQELEY